MRILVTGSLGFVGSHLCQKLLESEENLVLGLDNFSSLYPQSFRNFILHKLSENPRFQFTRTNILDKEKLNKIFKQFNPEVLFHAAAMVGVRESIVRPSLYIRVNLEGTTNLLELCRDCKVKITVLLSSSSVYGEKGRSVFVEKDQKLKPISPYSVSKLAMESMAYTFHHLYGFKITIIRPFSIYGPAGRVDMMPMKVILAAENGETITRFGNNRTNKRDWTYIDDFIRGCLSVLKRPLGFEIVNLGHHEPVGIETFLQIAQRIIKERMGKNFKIRPAPRPREELSVTFADITKARKLFNYSPKVDFEAGFIRTVDFYVKNRILYRDLIRK